MGTARDEGPVLKVLVSAYACEPGAGSEPEVGLQTVSNALTRHEVWVITRSNNLLALEEHFASHPRGHHLHLVGLDLGSQALSLKRASGVIGMYLYYALWQRRAGILARGLHEKVGFDVAHHATFANYWATIGILGVDVPVLIGPVGGGVYVPLRLLPELGLRGSLSEATRWLIRGLRKPSYEVSGSRRYVLAQNRETARRIRAGAVRILPNAVGIAPNLIRPPASCDLDVAVAARLVRWKGVGLVIRALDKLDGDATLTIYGTGPDEQRLRELADSLGLADRIHFYGRADRGDLLARLVRHRVLVIPSLREEASLAAAEALGSGVPVVALDQGGPPEVARQWPDVPNRLVSPAGGRRRVVEGLAAAIEELRSLTPSPRRWRPPAEELASVVDALYLELGSG